MRCHATGPSNARIAIVGDIPTLTDEASGTPFNGSPGYELKKMLSDARLNREECFLTNLCMDCPPQNKIESWISPKKKDLDGSEIKFRGKRVKPHVKSECERLYAELQAVGPNVVIAAGNAALWALTPYDKVGKWRGSILESDAVPGLKVIPTYHPAAILRMYDWRFITVQDYRRAATQSLYPEIRRPAWNFITAPTADQVMDTIRGLLARADSGPLPLVSDVEIKRTEVLCVGIAWSKLDAICIPFYGPQPDGSYLDPAWHYYDEPTHVAIVLLLHRLFRHPNVRLVNQNLSFDIQYFFWKLGFLWPRAHFDTMIAQNVLFPGLTKKLDFLASMYCSFYQYWKDDGKFWKEGKIVNYPQLWRYNCMDCTYTFEVMEEQEKAIDAFNLRPQFEFQMNLFQPVMEMMLRGVQVNTIQKKEILSEVAGFVEKTHAEVKFMANCDLTGDKGGFSPQKLQTFFYKQLGFKPMTNRTKGITTITCDDEAMKKLGRLEPLIRPLTERINLIRSYKTAVDAVSKKVDSDGRWRTSYNLAGTETYRFSSSENPFGSGLNLQNLTVGKEIL